MNKTQQKISFGEKVGYGFGDLASNLYWQTISMYLLIFYTDTFKIPALAISLMVIVSRVLDGINDPMMGMIADRTQTKWGKFRPYLLWLSIPLAFAGVLAFTTPDFGATGKIVYAYITFNFLMIIYTAINIPYSSLMGVMTNDSVQRTGLSSVKFIFAYSGGLIVSSSALYLSEKLGGGNDVKGWQLTMVLFGAASIIFFLVTFLSSKERILPPVSQKTSVKDDLNDLFSNKPWLLLLLTGILMIVFVATRLSATPFYFKYYVGEQNLSFFGKEITGGYVGLTSAYNVTSQALSITGVVFAFWFAKRFGKKSSFLGLFLVAIISTGAVFFLKPENIILLFLLQILGSVSGGPLTPLIWAMYADSADYSEWKNGRRATGLVFSASTMSQKMGWAIGGSFAALILGLIGYEADSEPTEKIVLGIRALVSIIPAVAGLLAIITMFFYQLSEEKMKGIQEELSQRRSKDGSDTKLS